MDVGVIGGVVGGTLGLAGALVGTYSGLRGAAGPRHRAAMLGLAVAGWLWVGLLVAWLLLMPAPWDRGAVLLTLPVLLVLPLGRRALARARAADEA